MGEAVAGQSTVVTNVPLPRIRQVAEQEEDVPRMTQSLEDLTIFEDSVYRRKLDEYNPGLREIHQDLLRLGPAELANPTQELSHDEDRLPYVPFTECKEWTSPLAET